MNFQEMVKCSLGTYRKENLGIQDAGEFRYRGRDIPKEHILPTEYMTSNIIKDIRDDFYSSSISHIDFHKYFHHLNSSQALCINLFFPLIFEEKLHLILDLLGIPKDPITDACFEKESEMETGVGRKTNFDFYLRLSKATKVYFEIKYTESEFGKAINDSEHRAKFANTYLPLLKDNGYINPEFRDANRFLDSYQIMRNLCHIGEHSFVVFIYPEANHKIHNQAQTAREINLTDEGRSKFRILTLESTIDEILKQVQTSRLKKHYQEFKVKYLSYMPTQ